MRRRLGLSAVAASVAAARSVRCQRLSSSDKRAAALVSSWMEKNGSFAKAPRLPRIENVEATMVQHSLIPLRHFRLYCWECQDTIVQNTMNYTGTLEARLPTNDAEARNLIG